MSPGVSSSRSKFACSAVVGGASAIVAGLLISQLDWDQDGRSALQEYYLGIDSDKDGEVSPKEVAYAAILPLITLALGIATGLSTLFTSRFLRFLLAGARHLRLLSAMQTASPFAVDGLSPGGHRRASLVEMATYLENEFSETIAITKLPGRLVRQDTDTPSTALKKFQCTVRSMSGLGMLASRQPGKLDAVAKNLDNWNLDMFDIDQETKQPLAFMGMLCLDAPWYNLPADVAIHKGKLSNFLTDIEDSYRPVPYHNSLHAAAVARMVFVFIKGCGLKHGLPGEMQLTLVLAGLVHDVHHPGLTASFLSRAALPWKSKIVAPREAADSELAMRYNDQSPLENMHCAITFQLLGNEKNAFLPDEIVTRIKPVLVRVILGTDMAKHAEAMTRLAMLTENLKNRGVGGIPWHWPTTPPASLPPEDRQHWERNLQVGFVMELFLHAADIGNPTLPLQQWKEWNRRVQLEFHEQGDMEKEEFGCLISPPPGFDRHAGAKAMHNFTKGFMQFLSLPLFQKIDELSKVQNPQNVTEDVNISVCLENLQSNLKAWDEIVPEDN